MFSGKKIVFNTFWFLFFIGTAFHSQLFCQQHKHTEFLLTDTSFTAGQVHTIRTIFFETGTYKLKPESTQMLDVLVYFLKKNKNLVVEIGDHFSEGEAKNSSDTISGKRAFLVKNYLAEHGIEAERLSSKGYGDRKLLIKEEEINKMKSENDKEVLRNFNRRIELTILRTDYKN